MDLIRAVLAHRAERLLRNPKTARHGYSVNANRELFALGLANMGTALSGGFPVAASGSRTAVNEGTGARGKLSGAIAAAVTAAIHLRRSIAACG